MVRIRASKGRGAKYVKLLEDPAVQRWHQSAARGSQITADVYLRRLGSVCAARGTTPNDLLKKTSSERRDFLTDLVSSMEEQGLSGGYIESTLKAIRSWLSFNNVPWEHRIKVRGSQATPTLENRLRPRGRIRSFLGAGRGRVRLN